MDRKLERSALSGLTRLLRVTLMPRRADCAGVMSGSQLSASRARSDYVRHTFA